MSVIAFLPWPHHKSTCSKKLAFMLWKAPHAAIVSWTGSNLGFAHPAPMQRGDGRDKSPTCECEFTQTLPALIHPILLPLKEVKVYLGRWLSVLSFREEALAWARVSHTDFEVCYEIINAVSLKAPHWPVQLTDRIAWCPAWMPEQNCSGFSEMVWNRTIPLCPGHTINKNHKQHECVQGESGQGGRSCWDLEQWTGYSMTRDSWARRGSCVGTCVLTWSVAAELGAGSEQGCSCCCKGLPALGSGRARARPYLLCPLTLLFLDSQCHCWTSPNGYSLCDVKLLGRMGSLTIRVFPYLCWSLQLHDWLKNLCFCWALQWMVRCIMYLS